MQGLNTWKRIYWGYVVSMHSYAGTGLERYLDLFDLVQKRGVRRSDLELVGFWGFRRSGSVGLGLQIYPNPITLKP